jgi:hypothetical protein
VLFVPLEDILQESMRIIEDAEKRGVVLRLFGGMAIRFHCPSATHRGLTRKYADIDFMGLSKQSRKIQELFVALGYEPRGIFNRLQGARRLIFNDIANQRRVDIFLDVFEMCHKFNFEKRLTIDKPTIPLADLLVTKLQVVEMTEREYRDIIAMIKDHPIGDSDAPETINGAYIASLCADNWGVYKTFQVTIDNVLSSLTHYDLDSESVELVQTRLKDLRDRIEKEPKGMRWKMRAQIGEKKQWYELPEMDKEVVGSPIL